MSEIKSTPPQNYPPQSGYPSNQYPMSYSDPQAHPGGYVPPPPEQGYQQQPPQGYQQPSQGYQQRPQQQYMQGVQPAVMLTQPQVVVTQPQVMVMGNCAQGQHFFTTQYGACGIIAAILLFPIGLIFLFTDQQRVCTRCGIHA
ncbi:hypothetical protein K439DRAFT_1634091 [Ramaria rubella]|nr:hypothetical protein K439DRAFT_1634091 [Ramaria rubella]